MRFSRRTLRIGATAAAIAITAALAGCVDDGTGPAGEGGADSANGPVPDVITAYPKDSWNVTITSIGAPQSSNRSIQEWFMDEIERRTSGAVLFHRTESSEICAQSDQYSCIQSGAAGLMVQVPNYQPTVFAASSLPELTFNDAADNSAAVAAAMADLYKNNADVKAYYDAKGLVPVATWSVGRLLLGSSVPLEGPDDLNGLTMRTAGTIAAPDLAAAGVVPTQVTSDEAYNSFSTGLVKAAAGSLDFVVQWKLGEVLPYWVDPGLGVYSEFAMFWGKDQWDEFPADVQAVIADVQDDLNGGKLAELYEDGYTTSPMDAAAATAYPGALENCRTAQAMSSVKSMTKWSDDQIAEFKALGAKTDSGSMTNEELWVKNATAAGLQNAAGVLDEYMADLDKYSAQFPDYVDDIVTQCIGSFQR